MRLNVEEKNKIIQYAKVFFGNEANLYLFGSRVDDAKKGGDIDLFLESEEIIDMQTQIQFLTAIYKDITQRKVDLLVKMPTSKNLTIYIIAKQEGILLC
ncbi:DNA polymerase subunit beta [Methylococcaceae bacterium CS1]|nr:DNA polymerase subunit beta [Methylococcaceae bacterium CS4]TXK94640.1 DNA polymerase subunit beta [Methylococcaceae bacterium CS5]TXL02936.1 DNA polymerase subunit beta [Methylococcaceae bacterium CS3]TXL03551.1 DNA polymerase subunit beta [Methylococcaceae bacterium CS1]